MLQSDDSPSISKNQTTRLYLEVCRRKTGRPFEWRGLRPLTRSHHHSTNLHTRTTECRPCRHCRRHPILRRLRRLLNNRRPQGWHQPHSRHHVTRGLTDSCRQFGGEVETWSTTTACLSTSHQYAPVPLEQHNAANRNPTLRRLRQHPIFPREVPRCIADQDIARQPETMTGCHVCCAPSRTTLNTFDDRTISP